MGLIKLYIDEDAVYGALLDALRSRGVAVLTPLEAVLMGKPDEEQLSFATQRGCALYTYNVADFCRLHFEWVRTGRKHAGIIVARQQHFSVGEQLRRILRIRTSVSAEAMRDRIEFLANWG